MPIPKQYLGDSVYAEVQNGMIRLTTDNDAGASNEIWLEPEVFNALKRYEARVREICAATNKPQKHELDVTV